MKHKKSVVLHIINSIEKGMILFLSILLLTNVASALDTGWVAPTNNVAGSGTVNSPQNAYLNDSVYASFSSSGTPSRNYFDYVFSSIPGGAAIDRIEVNARGYRGSDGYNRYMRVRLSWDNGATWTSYSTSTAQWTSSNNDHILVASANDWGHSWTTNEIMTSFRVQAQWMGSATGYLDYLPVRVYYTEPQGDSSRPSVTVNQASGQADPTKNSPINFEVVFNETVSGFIYSDVTLGGSALPTTAVVTGGGTTYNVAVGGMANDGIVTVSIAENVANDSAGNGNTASINIDNIVTYDTTAPSLTVPAHVNAEATATLTSVTIGTALATDLVDATPTITSNAPASYPVGTTTVTWTATDDAGNSATATQTVTVVDTTAPSLTAPGPVSAEATGILTSVTIGSATATDLVDGSLIVTNDAPGTFPLGTTTVTYTATDSHSNTATATQTVTVVDTTAPSITSPANISTEATGILTSVTIGTATASDLVDSTPTITNNAPASYPVGITTVTWTATDDAGNSATATQTVTVQNTMSPIITLSGSSPVTVETGSIYTDAGATALDNIDGDLTSLIVTGGLPVNTNVLGTHIITYDVTNSNGNAATQVTRTVNVIDTTLPVITLSGSSPVTVEAGSVYTDAGATAQDNYDGNLTSSIVAGGLPVDTNILGAHTVTYNVTDSNSNAAIQVTRTVNVVDTTPPVITLLGSNPVTVETGFFVYTDAGATALDNHDGDLTLSILTGGLPVNTNILGPHTVTYDLTDSNGNAAIRVTRIVNVISTLPTIRYINGTVIDSGISHTPLAGVTVSTTGRFTVTDGSGKYSLAVVSGSYPLTASYDIRYYTNSSVTVSTVSDAVVNQDIELQLKPVGTISGTVTVG